MPNAVSVFTCRPHVKRWSSACAAGAGQRGGDCARLAAARERCRLRRIDYVIVNETFDTAVDEMCAIFTASRLRKATGARHADLIQALLS